MTKTIAQFNASHHRGCFCCGRAACRTRLLGLPILSLFLAVLLLIPGAGVQSAELSVLSGPLQGLVSSPSAAGERLIVEVWFETAAQAASANFGASGAQVMFRAGQRVQCQLLASQLPALASLPGIALIIQPAPLVAASPPQIRAAAQQLAQVQPSQTYGYGGTVSEAVQFTNASAFQANGITGRGASIAIVALGFGAGASEGGQFPAAATVSFRADGGMGADPSGTAMAEVVADMAPQADLTLIAVDTALSLRQAVNYVTGGGFTAVVCGAGSVDGPFDGTDVVCQALATAANAGVFWIQAIGDYAQRHWQGSWIDANADGFLDFAGGSGIGISLPGGRFMVMLSWYESSPGGVTAQDYDLALYSGSGATATLIAQSSVTQNGHTPPIEILNAQVPASGVYELRIKAINIDATHVDKFQLYTPYVDLPGSIAMAVGALPSPAMSPHAFTIGSAAVFTDTAEAIISRGPTITGLMKPDMVGPDAVSTSVFGVRPPGWISSACGAAHIAGAVALLYSEDSNRTAEDIKRTLKALAVPLPDAASSPNNTFGYGRLNLRVGLDTQPPLITVFYPLNSSTISTRLPLIRARITDAGMGVDASSLVVKIDGMPQTGFSFNPATGLLSYQVTTPLALASHQLTIDVSDVAGNAATTAVINFRVALPSLDAGLHLLSLPYTYAAGSVPTPATVFGAGGTVQMARWWPGDSQYHIYPDAYGSFEPPDAVPPNPVVTAPPAGLGYFVRLSNQATLNLTGTPLTGTEPYPIRLSVGYRYPTGWNMIGCPFTSPVDWGSVQLVTNGVRQNLAEAVASGVTSGVLFAFASSGTSGSYTFPSDPYSATLEPFKGYWIHVWKDTTLLIYPPSVATAAAPAPRPLLADPDAWRVQLTVTAGGAEASCNYIGQSPNASDGYNTRGAVLAPPSADSRLSACLVQSDWGDRSGNYAQIIKPAGSRQTWNFQIACNEPGSEVVVRWPELNSVVPTGVSLLLQDLDNGREVFMRTSTGYSFTSGPAGSLRHLRLIAAPAGSLGSLAINSLSAQAAPSGGMAFTYALSAPAEVTAEIRNLSGVLIKRLAAGTTQGGAVELLVWNGRNERGSRVPGGRYLVSIIARAENGQTVQAIRPFEVNP